MSGERKALEWTPGHWWAVEVTGKDDSVTPLYKGQGPHAAAKKADAEAYARGEPVIHRMGSDNPMWDMGYRWEVFYPDGGRGGASERVGVELLAKAWKARQSVVDSQGKP